MDWNYGCALSHGHFLTFSMSALHIYWYFYTLSPTSPLCSPLIHLGSTQDYISLVFGKSCLILIKAFLIRVRMSPKLLQKISLVPNARIRIVGYGALCNVLLSLPVIPASLAPDTPLLYTSPPPANCTLPVLACPTLLSPMTQVRLRIPMGKRKIY